MQIIFHTAGELHAKSCNSGMPAPKRASQKQTPASRMIERVGEIFGCFADRRKNIHSNNGRKIGDVYTSSGKIDHVMTNVPKRTDLANTGPMRQNN